jgi:hypothetical protein
LAEPRAGGPVRDAERLGHRTEARRLISLTDSLMSGGLLLILSGAFGIALILLP